MCHARFVMVPQSTWSFVPSQLPFCYDLSYVSGWASLLNPPAIHSSHCLSMPEAFAKVLLGLYRSVCFMGRFIVVRIYSSTRLFYNRKCMLLPVGLCVIIIFFLVCDAVFVCKWSIEEFNCFTPVIKSEDFCSASSSPLLYSEAYTAIHTVTELTRRSVAGKNLPKVPTWWLKWDSNVRPSGHKAPDLPLSHRAPQLSNRGHFELSLSLVYCLYFDSDSLNKGGGRR